MLGATFFDSPCISWHHLADPVDCAVYRTGRLLLTDGPKPPMAQQLGTLPGSRASSVSLHSLDAVFPIVDIHADCLDITDQYKFPRGRDDRFLIFPFSLHLSLSLSLCLFVVFSESV